MIFHTPTVFQSIIVRDKDTFGEWSCRQSHSGLFNAKREPNYALDDIIYLFIKRLGQNMNDVMMMDEELRDKLFLKELKLLEKENEK